MASSQAATYQVLDIGGSKLQVRLETVTRHAASRGEIEAPKELAYTTAMTQWDKVSTESHQTDEEEAVIQATAAEVIAHFQDRCVIVDLGAAKSRKAFRYIKACLENNKDCVYIAHDLERQSLEAHLEAARKRYPSVKLYGLWGSFEDADIFFSTQKAFIGPFLFLSLGSIFYNAPHEKCITRLQSLEKYMTPADVFIVGQDSPSPESAVPYTTPGWGSFINSFIEEVDRIVRGSEQAREIKQVWACEPCMVSPSCHAFTIENREGIPVWDGSVLPAGKKSLVFQSYKLDNAAIQDIHRQARVTISATCLLTAVEAGYGRGTMVQYMLRMER